MQEDVLLGYEIIKDLIKSGSPDVFRTFLESTFQQAFKKIVEEKFNESCLFHQILVLIQKSGIGLLEKDFKYDENFLILSDVLDEYLDKISVESVVFELYLEVVCSLPSKLIFALTDIKEPSSGRLKKNIIVRCEALKTKENIENSLIWMNQMLSIVFQCKR